MDNIDKDMIQDITGAVIKIATNKKDQLTKNEKIAAEVFAIRTVDETAERVVIEVAKIAKITYEQAKKVVIESNIYDLIYNEKSHMRYEAIEYLAATVIEKCKRHKIGLDDPKKKT